MIIRFKEEIIKRLKGILPLELGLKMLHNPGKLPALTDGSLVKKMKEGLSHPLESRGEKRTIERSHDKSRKV